MHSKSSLLYWLTRANTGGSSLDECNKRLDEAVHLMGYSSWHLNDPARISRQDILLGGKVNAAAVTYLTLQRSYGWSYQPSSRLSIIRLNLGAREDFELDLGHDIVGLPVPSFLLAHYVAQSIHDEKMRSEAFQESSHIYLAGTPGTQVVAEPAPAP